MTLYTLVVPDPPAGVDWQTVVPGLRVYDVTGITATLATDVSVGPAVQQLLFGATNGAGSVLKFVVQPFSATENQFEFRSESTFIGLSDTFPSLSDGQPHMFAVVWDGANEHYYLDGAPIGIAQPVTPSGIGGALDPGEMGFAGPGSTIIDEMSTHRAALSAGQIASLHAAGLAGFAGYNTAIMALTPGTYYHFDGPSPTAVCADASGNGHDADYTSVSGSPQFVPGLVPGNDALHWSAPPGIDETRVINAPFDVDWDGPFTIIMWSLQETGVPSTGRTPGLSITDGQTEVVLVGDGFTAQATPGPYRYSWQPRQQSNARSPDGLLTTVGIPELILPGGYTIGSKTPDLAPADQWSNIIVQWSDTYQQLTTLLPPYDYPPGAFYTYKQIGATP